VEADYDVDGTNDDEEAGNPAAACAALDAALGARVAAAAAATFHLGDERRAAATSTSTSMTTHNVKVDVKAAKYTLIAQSKVEQERAALRVGGIVVTTPTQALCFNSGATRSPGVASPSSRMAAAASTSDWPAAAISAPRRQSAAMEAVASTLEVFPTSAEILQHLLSGDSVSIDVAALTHELVNFDRGGNDGGGGDAGGDVASYAIRNSDSHGCGGGLHLSPEVRSGLAPWMAATSGQWRSAHSAMGTSLREDKIHLPPSAVAAAAATAEAGAVKRASPALRGTTAGTRGGVGGNTHGVTVNAGEGWFGRPTAVFVSPWAHHAVAAIATAAEVTASTLKPSTEIRDICLFIIVPNLDPQPQLSED